MNDSDHERFKQAFLYMVSLYPNATMHEGIMPAFWKSLQHFDIEVVVEAFKRAPNEYTDWVPTGPQVQMVARDISKGREALQRADVAGLLPSGEKVKPRVHPEFEELAKQWEAQCSHDSYIGEDEGVKRSRLLFEMYDRVSAGGKEQQSQGQPERETVPGEAEEGGH